MAAARTTRLSTQTSVPGEVLLLSDEDVVRVVDTRSGVIPAGCDALVLRAPGLQFAGKPVDVGVRDGLAGHGGAPRQVEQGGVELLLQQRWSAMADERADDPGDGEDDRREDAHRFDELASFVARRRGSLQAQHVLVELPFVDRAPRHPSDTGGDRILHGLVIRGPNSFFHSA